MRMYVFSLLPGGAHAHQVVRSFPVEVGREPIPRFAQSGLAPLLVQPQHQIDLLVRYFSHVSSFGLDCRLVFRGTRRTDFRPRWARKSTELEHPEFADRRRAARDGDSYDS